MKLINQNTIIINLCNKNGQVLTVCHHWRWNFEDNQQINQSPVDTDVPLNVMFIITIKFAFSKF